MKKSSMINLLVVLSCSLMLAACSVRLTEVNRSHELIQSDRSSAYASVYFIRPGTEHPMGFADNLLAVELDGEKLIDLAKGEYTLVHLKPRDVEITLRNRTQVRGRWEVTEMTRSDRFSFREGRVYFLLAEMFDGEFRGVHFTPKSITLPDAREAVRTLEPAGLARQAPIDRL